MREYGAFDIREAAEMNLCAQYIVRFCLEMIETIQQHQPRP
jgi:hypothetical protein